MKAKQRTVGGTLAAAQSDAPSRLLKINLVF